MKREVGAVVKLFSGGASMTIEMTHKNDAQCVWMTEDGELYRDVFPIQILAVVSEGPEPENLTSGKDPTHTQH